MRFIVDAQLPPALARWLVAEGYESIHVVDVALHAASDSAIWSFAMTNNYVIVSKDEDFARRRNAVSAGPSIIWMRLPNQSTRTMIDRLRAVLPQIIASLERGEVIVAVAQE